MRGAVLILALSASLALLGSPVEAGSEQGPLCSNEVDDDADGKIDCADNDCRQECADGGGGDEYHFRVVFSGNIPLLENYAEGVPWELISGTGGHGNIGSSEALINGEKQWIPVVAENVAAIGDATCPCLTCPCDEPCGECAARLGNAVGPDDLKAETLKFLGENQWYPGTLVNNVLYFRFTATDPDDGTVYQYTVTPHGVADYDAHPWEPEDPAFCVPIDYTHVKIWGGDGTKVNRSKGCKQNNLFLTCEAQVLEDYALDFQVTIWRAEASDWGPEPPC